MARKGKKSGKKDVTDDTDRKLNVLLQNRTPYDDMDLRILMLLKMDARMSNISLAKELDVNEVTITRRLQNLWERNIIKCAFTIVNFQKLGLTLKATMSLKVSSNDLESLVNKLRTNSQVFCLYRIIDPYQKNNLVCDMMFRDMSELQEFFDKVNRMKGVLSLEYYILSKPFKYKDHLKL